MNKNNNTEAIKMNNELGIMNVQGVDCYEKDGVVYLNLEAVARGLGFTEIAASGNECIRWRTIRKYLTEFGIATSCDGGLPEYLPENIFYRLAMKAKNEVAEKFQAKVADEIIPSIRKHGAYMTPETIKKVLLNPDTIISLATALKEEQQKTAKLTAENAELKPKADFADTVSNSTGALNMSQMAKLLHNKHIDMGRNRLMNFLRSEKILMQDNLPYQQYIERGYFKVIESVVGSEQYPIAKTSTLVLPAGQQFIFNLLEKRGEISA